MKSDSQAVSHISHSNFHRWDFTSNSLPPSLDTITDCLIEEIYSIGNYLSPIYISPFSYCIINYLENPINILGFLQNAQTNANGDSCDLWFNLNANSSKNPIKAASDGTNIGYYQGEGVSILPSPMQPGKNITKNVIRPVSGMRNVLYSNLAIDNKDAALFIYNSSGRCIVSRRGIGGKQLIALPFSLIPGTYIYSLENVQSKITGKLVIH